jgi:hypothetical protein
VQQYSPSTATFTIWHMAPSEERPRRITLRTTTRHHHISHDVCVRLYQWRSVKFRAARKIQNNGGGGPLNNTDNWLECSTHRVRQLEKFREKLVKRMFERKKMQTKKVNLYSFTTNCVSVCYDRLKGTVYCGITEFRSASLSWRNFFLAVMMVIISSAKQLSLLLVLSFR